jgi:ABC-2 type transport system permease protein
MFSIIGRSAMPGIALAIGVFFLESIVTAFMSLAGGWIAKIPDYLTTENVRTITNLGGLPSNIMVGTNAGGALGGTPGVVHATVTLAVYILASLAIAFYFFRKRDVTG